ncbi:hypothetical protein SCHPADRAFT_675383 [Schizopora paradoxa]|uniref:MYND-type domain-containing protein n=1 Tax=Schizopora paradoxa TaxID=27342 RepID=A0A0H2R4Y9_9AGAM|nr:hypothetical protein SCHPADRAFT_675383 [Schizopora paradoxa]
MGKSRANSDNTINSPISVKVLKNAETDLPTLSHVSSMVNTLPDKQQGLCFNLFHHHLQKKIEDHLCDSDNPYDWVTCALLGIRNLGTEYFKRSENRKQQFIGCWPDIFKWLRAMLNVQDSFEDGLLFWSFAAEATRICLSLHQDVLHEDEVVEFAVRCWIGRQGKDGEDYYTEFPLMACLSVLLTGEQQRGVDLATSGYRIEKALDACDLDISDFASAFVTRLAQRINKSEHTTRMGELPFAMVGLPQTLGLIVRLRWLRFIPAVVNPKVGRCLVAALQVVVDEYPPSPDRLLTINSLLSVIQCSLLLQDVDFAVAIVERGFLGCVIKIAAFELTTPLPGVSMTCDVLNSFLPYLVFSDMVVACRRAFEVLHNHQAQLRLLKETKEEFQHRLIDLENVTLEYNIFLRLTNAGFAPERGICANRACSKKGFRSEFQKCAGCSFILYCSQSCQRQDWDWHRNHCKKLTTSSRNILRDRYIRFPRRLASFYIHRHLRQILAPFSDTIKSQKSFPSNVVVSLNYLTYPASVQVYERTVFLQAQIESDGGHFATVAHEVHRQNDEETHGLMVIINFHTHSEMEIPCVIHYDDVWSRGVSIPNESLKYEGPGIPTSDKEGRPLICPDYDALRAGVVLTKKFAFESGESVWAESVLEKSTSEVLKEFARELEMCKGAGA